MEMEGTSAVSCSALVTGGAGGIGWAICRRLVLDGYHVIIADRDAQEARRRAASLGADHSVLEVDLTDPQAAGALVGRALAAAPKGLRLIVNNAGMTDTGGHALCAMPQSAYDRIVALNLTAVEQICAAAIDALAPGGTVVNIASGAAWRPLPLRGPYSATKAAIVALTEGLAESFAARGLRIGGVAPGYTMTPLIEQLSRAGRVNLDAVADTIPLARLARPEDIAEAVAFMASDAGAALAGQVLLVDGGGSQGQAPATGAPERGTQEATGKLAWLGKSSPASDDESASLAELGAIRPLAAVIDATALDGMGTPADVMGRVRDTARACAAHAARCRDFALVLVAPEGVSPTERAGQAAQAMLARTLALEWARAGLRVNAVSWRGGDGKRMEALCRFLAGPAAEYITGQTIVAGHPPAHAGVP